MNNILNIDTRTSGQLLHENKGEGEYILSIKSALDLSIFGLIFLYN